MPKSWWAGEEPGGWRGVDAEKLEGTESVGSGFELGLCPLTSRVATLSLSSPPANEDNSTHHLDFCWRVGWKHKVPSWGYIQAGQELVLLLSLLPVRLVQTSGLQVISPPEWVSLGLQPTHALPQLECFQNRLSPATLHPDPAGPLKPSCPEGGSFTGCILTAAAAVSLWACEALRVVSSAGSSTGEPALVDHPGEEQGLWLQAPWVESWLHYCCWETSGKLPGPWGLPPQGGLTRVLMP